MARWLVLRPALLRRIDADPRVVVRLCLRRAAGGVVALAGARTGRPFRRDSLVGPVYLRGRVRGLARPSHRPRRRAWPVCGARHADRGSPPLRLASPQRRATARSLTTARI